MNGNERQGIQPSPEPHRKVEETVGTAIGDDHMRAKGKMDQRKAALKGVGEKVKDAASKLKWKPRMGRPQVVELGVVESVT